jgi:hypothetical protein
MNKLYTFFWLLMLFPVIVLSQTKAEKKALKEAYKNRDKYLFAARPTQKNFSHTLSFEYYHGQIIVPVVIDGETYRFMFDTGAVTAVSNEIKEKLGVKSIFSNNLEDASGQVEERLVYPIGQIQLGPVVFKDIVAAAVDMTKFEKQFCRKIDGLFGANVMRSCHWKIDYKARTITFSDKEIKPDGKVTEIDFTETFSGTPLTRQVLGQYQYPSIVDTGSNGGFSISDSLFFNSGKLHGTKFLIGRGKSSMSVFGTKFNYEYIAVLDSVYVGNRLMKNQLVNMTAGNSYITGNKVFEKFGTMILNWRKKKIYVPLTDVTEDKEFKTFGLSPVYIQDDLQVGMVWENSVEGINEIDPGDTIISIDDIIVEKMTREKWCEIVEVFSSDADTRPLPVTIRKKDGTEKQLVLKKTDLLKK